LQTKSRQLVNKKNIMYLNKAFIFGNLTRDPEMRSLPSGVQVTSFSIATNRVWKDQNGAKQESAEFHNIVVFGRQAETSAQYLKKGSSVLIEGRIQTRSWESEGQKKYRTEIVADRVQFGPRTGGAAQSTAPAQAAPKEEKDTLDTIEYPDEEINPEDIPF
jgi:single-strand DNA-binding protein